MSREKELFRDNLEVVYERFGNIQFIPIADVSEFLGIDKRALRSDPKFPVRKVGGRYFVSALALASFLS